MIKLLHEKPSVFIGTKEQFIIVRPVTDVVDPFWI